MGIELLPPNRNPVKIFLAGSIEMGSAEPWQTKAVEMLLPLNVIICNPRRIDWDSSWKQTNSDPKFFEQVSWELDNIYQADIVFFYFDPKTKAPISLLELGLCCGIGKEIVCVCPDEFYRKGNVEITLDHFGYGCYNSFADGIKDLEKMILNLGK